jgi:hypothetical protein
MEKVDFFAKTAFPPLIGERVPSCYHPLWVSRKFCRKVAINIFTNEINGIHRQCPEKTVLFPPVNNFFRMAGGTVLGKLKCTFPGTLRKLVKRVWN